MPRLFVALRPPPEIRTALTRLMAGIEGARWQSDNQLHLTLAFLGELDRHQADAAADALATVRAAPFSLRLALPGSFDAAHPGRTGTLWIGVEGQDSRRPGPDPRPLSALAQSIRTALRRAGLAPDARKFTPHITLARFGPAGAPRDAIRPWLTHATPLPLAWETTDFHLVESTLGHEGAHYAPIASYALG
jgi:2'-5' RNA ligase